MKKVLTCWIFIVCILWMGNANATVIYGDCSTGSTETVGSMEGELFYEVINDTDAELQMKITNTSSDQELTAAYITGFAFNMPESTISSVLLKKAPANFMLIGGPDFRDSVAVPPFGNFDVGVTVGKNFLGGGPPWKGLEMGESGEFIFSLCGVSLDVLDEDDFISSMSSFPQGGGAQFLVTRVRGIAPGDGSNKLATQVVPVPSAIWLIGSGFFGLIGLRKKFCK